MTFVQAGTNSKITLSKFYVTALDVDGDNGNLQEDVQFQKADSVKLSAITNLSLLTPINCGSANTPFRQTCIRTKNKFDYVYEGPFQGLSYFLMYSFKAFT